MPQSRAGSVATAMFAKHGGMLRTSQALKLGIHPRTLYRLRDAGEIERVGRGLYRLMTASPLANPDWAAIMSRLPRAVICLISALAHHGLTTQVPHTTDVAMGGHARIPKIDGIPVRVFWFAEPAFSAGVTAIRIDGVSARVYSPEKTIADCFKYRNKIGLDIAIEALRTYRERQKRPNLKAIQEYARICRVEKIMRPYLEAVL